MLIICGENNEGQLFPQAYFNTTSHPCTVSAEVTKVTMTFVSGKQM